MKKGNGNKTKLFLIAGAEGMGHYALRAILSDFSKEVMLYGGNIIWLRSKI